ncbi:YpmS family protein [Sporosarcina sp. 179-K 3D1 HS]|uniref:YpmS family protein n=1 Tax=Sporosarcina sp. 179-K 3D1 HS TaxID=3232169 RepID=UPI0039A20B22
MNPWKISFFALAGLIIAAIIALVLFIGNPGESKPLPEAKLMQTPANVLTVHSTKEDLQGIANTYIRKAMKGEPLPVTMEVRDDVILLSEMTVFSYTLPVQMHFNPVVQEDGNLILKQSSMEIGQLNVPPSTVLKILQDSVALPPWMIVRPKEEELFIDLSRIPVSGNLQVKAKTFNLAEDEIILEIFIPNE